MTEIRFTKRSPIPAAEGSNLMRTLLDAEIPVASSCNGDGICAKCRVEVLEGAENLSPLTQQESFLKEKFELGSNIRVSCQCQVFGDVRITTGYW